MTSIRQPLTATLALFLAALLAAPGAAFGHGGEPADQRADLDFRAIEPPVVPTPEASCGPGDRPETGLQGRVSPDDHSSGRAAAGFTCNTELVGSYTKPNLPINVVPGFENTIGSVGGFKVLRYVDADGHECAYYDTTLLFPTNIFDALAGVNVLDMSDPSNPVNTDRLLTPAMLQPHESLALSSERGILAAITGTLAFAPGTIDIYDISQDCRHPVLLSTGSPAGILGHESGMSPDGLTFYSASAGGGTLVPVDISNPLFPVPLAYTGISSHGLTLSDDGNRAYVASTGGEGLVIYDTSEIQSRAAAPQMHEISRLDWTSMSIPQNAIPVTIKGKPYVVEIDEFGTLNEVGAGRVVDISDEANPFVVSNLRLEVHQPENFAALTGDVGASNPVGGYSGHYCNVPSSTDPEIVACSMGVSGLRIFDIRDPENPSELGYFNAPVGPRTVANGPSDFPPGASNWAMSAPAFVPERSEIWYSDAYNGFHAVRMTNDTWPSAAGNGGGNGGGGNGGGPGPGGGNQKPGGGGGDVGAGNQGNSDGAPDAGSEEAAAGGGGSIPFTGLALAGLLVCGLALLLAGALARLPGRRGA